MPKRELHILLVDAEHDLRAVMVAQLLAAIPQAQVLTADHAPVGLELALAENPDVIFFDLSTPETDGLDLCRGLASDARTEYIPRVALTGAQTLTERRREALSVGVEAFLSRSFDEPELQALVRAMAKLKRAGVSERAQEREAEDLNQRLIASVQEGVIVYGPDLRYRLWNPFMESFTGLPASEVLGKLPAEVFPFLEDVGVMDQLRRALRGEAPVLLEFPVNFGSEERWALDTTSPLRNDEGEIVGAISTVQDITERKRVEDALREREFFFRESQRAASIGSYDLDLAAGFWESSEVLDQIFGIDGSYVRTISGWLDLVHAADREAMSQYWDSLSVERRDHFSHEYRIVRASDGQVRWVLGLGKLEFSDAGDMLSMIGTIQDITERKDGEAALQESEERFRRASVYSPYPIMIHAEDGSVLQVSDSWCGITGYSREELSTIGDWTERAYGEEVSVVREHIDALYALDAARHEGKFVIRIKDGSLRTWDFSSAPLGRAPDGRRLVLSMAMDVTERERAEAEREQLEEQLLASQKMEAIGMLAGGVAHDFNNLLSVILSFSEMVLEDLAETDPMREDMLEVQNAGQRGAALTRQLLAFGRRQVLQPVSLDLNTTATALEKMLRRILGEDIEFVLTLGPDLGLVYADPGQVEQVLMNLVVNARDAMPDGGSLTIETSNVELDDDYALRHVGTAPGPHVQFTVTDTGCGMNEETKARIFEPFFTTKQKGRGTGLGLSTVYGIVQQSGGDIAVRSELGRGTTFEVHLPRHSSVTAMAGESPNIRIRPTGTETVLLVDDEDAIRKVARRSLEAAGYTVLTAAAGDEALETAAQYEGEIHLLLTDVVMPRMGGRVLAEALLKERPTLEVLYMSGYTDDAILHHGVLRAGTHFIGKPFAGARLTRKVRDVLDET